MHNYVTIYEEYKHKFFQLPKVFFTSDKYKNMSNNAKIAWAILRDRSSLSRKNEWFDKDTGRIYFIYKNKELMEILNVKSETTLSNIKKELENASLIKQKKMGFNRPNKLYLLYPIIEEEDIYKIDEFENYGQKEENNSQSQAGQGTPKIGAPKNGVPYPQKMEPSNTDSINTDLKDLDNIDTEDTKKDFSISHECKEKLKKEYIRKAFYENHDKVPEELGKVFSVFCRTTKEAEMYYKSINKAKIDVFTKALEENDTMLTTIISLEDEPELLQQIVNTFVRVIRKVEKEQNINNPTGYLYKAVYKVIWDYFDLSSKNNLLNYNWLNES